MNQITIYKDNTLAGDVLIPASKSIIHRAIIAGALSKKEVIINNAYISNDISATLNAITSLGASYTIEGNDLHIFGFKSFHLDKDVEIDAKESGSTLRFIIPLCTLFDKKVIIKGEESLFVRPLDVYSKLFNENGAIFIKHKDYLEIDGSLNYFDSVIDGSISSQFISGLLFMAPLLKTDTTLKIKNLQSIPYVKLTIKVLELAGIKLKYDQKLSRIFIYGNQEYNLDQITSFGDYSQAANFFVLNALTNYDIRIKGLKEDSIQGDKEIVDIVGIYKYYQEHRTILKKKGQNFHFNLRWMDKLPIIDISQTPDLGPILMVLLTKTGGYLKNFRRLIYKESNRVLSMTEELRKFGVVVKEMGKYLYIPKYLGDNLQGLIDSHNDHRVLMAMVVMGLSYNQEMVIEKYEAVNKSYPSFFDDLVKLGVKLHKNE